MKAQKLADAAVVSDDESVRQAAQGNLAAKEAEVVKAEAKASGDFQKIQEAKLVEVELAAKFAGEAKKEVLEAVVAQQQELVDKSKDVVKAKEAEVEVADKKKALEEEKVVPLKERKVLSDFLVSPLVLPRFLTGDIRHASRRCVQEKHRGGDALFISLSFFL